MKTLLIKFFAGLLVSLLASSSFAANPLIPWPSRSSQVLCGGAADGEDLSVRTVLPEGLLAAESPNGRVVVYIDLRKEGRVRLVFSEGLSDADYERRETLLSKLPAEEAEFLRRLSASRQSDLYTGFTDGFVHLSTVSADRALTLSCQEIKVESGPRDR